MMTGTTTESTTFTITHAQYLASKVAADLKRMQRFYDAPSDADISSYEDELAKMLKGGYVDTVTYGFRRNGDWIEPTLRYTARELAGLASADDDPGRIRPHANIDGAAFHSYMTYTRAWDELGESLRIIFGATLPFVRKGAPEPSVNGYMVDDRTYSAGGRALSRSSVRSY
jgi:HORMA domain-containing protein